MEKNKTLVNQLKGMVMVALASSAVLLSTPASAAGDVNHIVNKNQTRMALGIEVPLAKYSFKTSYMHPALDGAGFKLAPLLNPAGSLFGSYMINKYPYSFRIDFGVGGEWKFLQYQDGLNQKLESGKDRSETTSETTSKDTSNAKPALSPGKTYSQLQNLFLTTNFESVQYKIKQCKEVTEKKYNQMLRQIQHRSRSINFGVALVARECMQQQITFKQGFEAPSAKGYLFDLATGNSNSTVFEGKLKSDTTHLCKTNFFATKEELECDKDGVPEALEDLKNNKFNYSYVTFKGSTNYTTEDILGLTVGSTTDTTTRTSASFTLKDGFFKVFKRYNRIKQTTWEKILQSKLEDKDLFLTDADSNTIDQKQFRESLDASAKTALQGVVRAAEVLLYLVNDPYNDAFNAYTLEQEFDGTETSLLVDCFAALQSLAKNGPSSTTTSDPKSPAEGAESGKLQAVQVGKAFAYISGAMHYDVAQDIKVGGLIKIQGNMVWNKTVDFDDASKKYGDDAKYGDSKMFLTVALGPEVVYSINDNFDVALSLTSDVNFGTEGLELEGGTKGATDGATNDIKLAQFKDKDEIAKPKKSWKDYFGDVKLGFKVSYKI